MERKMENTTWEQRHEAVTHILTSPTTAPPLHSQLLISTLIPSYRNWDYPPLHSDHLSWGFRHLYLKTLSRMGFPETSWRSKCPYQQPPPLILAEGVEEARWGDEERREYVRRRLMKKKPTGIEVNPLIPVLIPNLLLLSTLLWNPFPEED